MPNCKPPHRQQTFPSADNHYKDPALFDLLARFWAPFAVPLDKKQLLMQTRVFSHKLQAEDLMHTSPRSWCLSQTVVAVGVGRG